MQPDKKYYNNARKPEGELGSRMLERMNGGTHAELAQWSLPFLKTDKSFTALDIGCGGGANLARLLGLCGKVYGVDYSDVSVRKSTEFNIQAIKEGRCEVFKGDVCSLAFEDGTFDAVTAFETVYFWQDIEKAFSQVYRVLKKGGTFFITNESNGTDESAVKMSAIIDGMKLYTPQALEKLLKSAGFEKITVRCHESQPWINVTAKK